MITSALTILISLVFVSLWLYASLSKLKTMKKFRYSMTIQVFPKWLGILLAWTLPFIELGLTGMLLFEKTRLTGLYISFGLMFVFTVYTAGAAYEFYSQYPCPCGGLFTRMGWKKHFRVNLLFTILAIAGIVLTEIGRYF